MQNKSQRESKSWFSRFSFMLILAICFLFAFFTVKEVVNRSKLDGEIAELNQQIEDLKLKKQNFLSLIDDYQGQFYLESEARLKLNKKRPGETVVVVKLDQLAGLDTTNSNNLGANNLPIENSDQSNLMLWWQYFFGEKIN